MRKRRRIPLREERDQQRGRETVRITCTHMHMKMSATPILRMLTKVNASKHLNTLIVGYFNFDKYVSSQPREK